MYINCYLAGEDDFCDVYEEVASICTDYNKLGLGLCVPPAELETIRNSCCQDVQAFTGVLLTWLRQQYNVKKYGPSTWRMLVKAVNNPAFGSNTALAKCIADKHPSNGEILTVLVYASGPIFIKSGIMSWCYVVTWVPRTQVAPRYFP